MVSVTLVVAAGTLFMAPVYSASVTLAVRPLTVDKPFDYPTAYQHGANDTGELIKSRAVAERAAKELGIGVDDLGPLEVQVMEKSSLVEVTAEGETPKAAAAAANGVARAYMEENAERLDASARQSQRALTKKLADLKGQIASLQRELEGARLKGDSSRIATIQDQISSTQSGYEQLLQQWQNLPASQMTLATAVQVVDEAKAETSPVRPKLSVNLALAVAGGFFVGLAIARTKQSLEGYSPMGRRDDEEDETEDGAAHA